MTKWLDTTSSGHLFSRDGNRRDEAGGISNADIDTMLRKNPAKLLGLDG